MVRTSDCADEGQLVPPDWDGIEQRMWRANASEVVDEANARSERLMKRIDLFVWRFGSTSDAVLQKIQSDPLFAAWFAKEPRRQSPHERIAADYLQGFDEIVNFVRLKQTGNEALYLNRDGEILSRSDFQGDRPSKALDFEWESPSGVRCLASHKYTKEGGGNQDSQYREQRTLLSNFQSRSTNNTALFVICDGPYYTEARMQSLRMQCRQVAPLSFATHIEHVPALVANLESN